MSNDNTALDARFLDAPPEKKTLGQRVVDTVTTLIKGMKGEKKLPKVVFPRMSTTLSCQFCHNPRRRGEIDPMFGFVCKTCLIKVAKLRARFSDEK